MLHKEKTQKQLVGERITKQGARAFPSGISRAQGCHACWAEKLLSVIANIDCFAGAERLQWCSQPGDVGGSLGTCLVVASGEKGAVGI